MSERGTFVVPIHDLDVTGEHARFTITPVWLRGALEGCEIQPSGPDGLLEVHLSKTGNEVLVQGQIDVSLTAPCARCLAPAEVRPHIELSLLLSPAASQSGPPRKKAAGGAKGAPSNGTAGSKAHRPSTSENDASGEEEDVDTYEGEEVVLDRFVREAILLESPTFPLCSDACEGIRPASESAAHATGAVTDPRFLPLLELAKRKNWKE